MVRMPALLAIACGSPQVDDTSAEPVEIRVQLENVSAPGALVPTSTGEPVDHVLAPGVVIVHREGWALFAPGAAAEQAGLEAMAEDGDNAPLLAALASDPEVSFATSFAAKDDVTYADAPLLPGEGASVVLEVVQGDRITLAAMYGESNDGFLATGPGGLPAFDEGGAAVDGDITLELSWWDLGTEVNEELGAGPSQPARQSALGEGMLEDGVVTAIDVDADGQVWPPLSEVVRATVL